MDNEMTVSIPMFNLLASQARLRSTRNNIISHTAKPGEVLDQVTATLDLVNEAIVHLHDMEQKGQVTR